MTLYEKLKNLFFVNDNVNSDEEFKLQRMEFIKSEEFKQFNRTQLFFATCNAGDVDMPLATFYQAVILALNNCEFINLHKDYISDNLYVNKGSDKSEIITQLKNKSNSYIGESNKTPQYVVDGGLRTISVLTSFSNLHNLKTMSEINKLLMPCIQQFELFNRSL